MPANVVLPGWVQTYSLSTGETNWGGTIGVPGAYITASEYNLCLFLWVSLPITKDSELTPFYPIFIAFVTLLYEVYLIHSGLHANISNFPLAFKLSFQYMSI